MTGQKADFRCLSLTHSSKELGATAKLLYHWLLAVKFFRKHLRDHCSGTTPRAKIGMPRGSQELRTSWPATILVAINKAKDMNTIIYLLDDVSRRLQIMPCMSLNCLELPL